MMWKTKGMQRDLSVSAFNPEFSFENRNLRLSTNDSNTLLSWVNERGTLKMEYTSESVELLGVPIGTAVLNHQLILFTTDNTKSETVENRDIVYSDHIYVLSYKDMTKETLRASCLYRGYLDMDSEHPLETLVSYEADNIQKVYWTDHKNSLRVINIAASSSDRQKWTDTSFDFVPTLKLEETVTVSKVFGGTGAFPSGVIQYAFTYYNKYGQESCIFYTSGLRYISPIDRGGAPDEKVSNAFEIKVTKVDDNFDYLRIYSILRTSINATPICKRVADIEIKGLKNRTANYIDNGATGDSIDPTELLYKGGENIIAGTIEQKDNTLFMGNLKITRPSLALRLQMEGYYDSSTHKLRNVDVDIESAPRTLQKYNYIPFTSYTDTTYPYFNQLSCKDTATNEIGVPCGGFSRNETYRCGVQFQYETGKWSDPLFIEDFSVPNDEFSSEDADGVQIYSLNGTLSSGLTSAIKNLGYKKARAVVVYPEIQDRNMLMSGVVCPTLYTEEHRHTLKDICCQSSWFFRPIVGQMPGVNADGTATPYSGLNESKGLSLPYFDAGFTAYNHVNQIEIDGFYNDNNCFKVGWDYLTFHSPDLEFDANYSHINYANAFCYHYKNAKFTRTLSDINIQTESPVSSSLAKGFEHKAYSKESSYGIISGPYYNDYPVDDNDDGKKIERWILGETPFMWMVYPWQRQGSLNNDIKRPADLGTPTSILKKKVISNLRYADCQPLEGVTNGLISIYGEPQLYDSDEATIIKVKEMSGASGIYYGNVDTMLSPDSESGRLFTIATRSNQLWYKTGGMWNDGKVSLWQRGYYKYENDAWNFDSSSDTIGNDIPELVLSKSSVRMRYKSSPHLVIPMGLTRFSTETADSSYLPIIDIIRNTISNRFGGNNLDALKANTWIPCGEPVELGNSNGETEFEYAWGDTYYQRWDCLKTYPFSDEDENQIVEIGSFMLETHTNIDGRYDRNRGQQSNLNMSPRNFNLLNPVYSQQNNFFTYKILDDDYYRNTEYHNQITWSKTKTSGADTDLWTNVTLANTLEMDGDKGKVNKLIRFNDQLLCFQGRGLSQILYNENVQIASTAGVPIEIANSEKVQGKRYLSDTVGCTNKWSVVSTPSGIYFIDSYDKSIYLFSGQLQNLSMQGGMNSWCKENILNDIELKWTPKEFDDFVAYYDQQNQDVLFINSITALAWSERLGAFTSFYDYGKIPYFCNFEDTGLWFKPEAQESDYIVSVWKHQAGEYCQFFGENKPYWMTLIGNPEPTLDKIFTNLEFRATVDGEGRNVTVMQPQKSQDEPVEPGSTVRRYEPYLPFDYLETWNEYQHGLAALSHRNGHSAMLHHTLDREASLKRKFRIWRCDIPRNNAYGIEDTFDDTFDETFHGIPIGGRQDRMRNPWLYLKLKKRAAADSDVLPKAEIHDMVMTYFG